MTNPPTRRRVALIVVAAPFLLASCAKKEEPPPVAPPAAPTAAPSTTLPTPTPTTVPTPPPVWRSARWGMTRAEVLAAFPREAQRLDRPSDFAKPQPGSILVAGSSDIAIPTYDADGATFRVLFGFEPEALERVHLAAVKPRAETCGDLEKALSERHSAASRRSSTGSSLKGEEIVWMLPDQTIVLGCGGVFSLGFVTVTLDYMAPAPRE